MLKFALGINSQLATFVLLTGLCGTHHTFYHELRVAFIHAAAHLDRSSFCCLSNFESKEFRVAETTDSFMSSCCLVNPGATLHTSGGAPSCTRIKTRLQV